MSDWDVYSTGTGTLTCDGHNAVIAGGIAATYEVVARHNTRQAKGNYQKTEIVLDTAPGSLLLANGHQDLWLRMTNFTSWATRTGMRMRYSANGLWTLDWFLSGTPTNIAAETLIPISPKMAATSRFAFYAGLDPEPRRFIATLNDKPFMDETEIGTTSQFGASYLFRGFGGRSESLIAPTNPGKIRQWTANG